MEFIDKMESFNRWKLWMVLKIKIRRGMDMRILNK